MKDPGHVVVASYNVHGCVGTDGVRDGQRILQVVDELAADVLALQEVDSRVGGLDPWGHLAGHSADLELIPGPTLKSGEGRYGNALLTRLPVRDVERLDLSVPGREARGAILAHLDLPGGRSLVVIATHLGLRHGERVAQAARLARALDALPPTQPRLLLGDLNAWRPVADGLAPLRRHLVAPPARRTFPARLPLLALDQIWHGPGSELEALRAHRSPTSAVASDHLPIVATLRA